MDYRTGKCSQCGAEYKVPASFAHNVARCKKCKGVVHLGPPPAAAGAPAAESAPTAAPASIPAKRVVPKPEAPRAPRPPAPAAARPAPTPTSSPTPSQAPAPKPAPAGGAPARGGTLERLKGERPAAAAGSAATPAARPGAPAAGAAKKPESAAEGRDKRGGRAERAKPGREKKKAPMAGILSGVGLLVVAAVLFLFRDKFFGDVIDPKAASVTPEGTPGAGPGGAATEPGAPNATAPGAVKPSAGDAREKPAEEPAVAAKTEEPKPAAKPESKAKDPASIDLAALPDFQPTPDTTPEEWAQMNEWMAQWMDVDAGAAGNKAKLQLIQQKRKAVPAILNFFKKQDFATREGRSNGDQCQKALQQICNGTNFDWKYADEAAGRPYEHPDDVWFCKRVVELWSNSWKQAELDIRAWIKMAKLEEKEPAEAKRLLEMFGGQSAQPAAGADDDLEVD